ncbi:MAG: NAD(P)/FAD-dependent oxidoreductase [Pseudomonadota bacterium]
MDSRTRDIAIVGCGPAGLGAAIALHDDGHRVHLLDRLAAPEPIGSGLLLQPTGLAVARELGLDHALRELGNPIDRLYGLTAPDARIALDVPYAALANGAHGLGIHRGALFQVLLDAAAARNIPVTTHFDATAVEATTHGRFRVVAADGQASEPCELVVNAAGTHSPLADGYRMPLAFGALWGTLDWPANGPFEARWLQQRYRRADIMIGVLPVGRINPEGPDKVTLFWSLEVDTYARWQAEGLGAWKQQVLSLWPETACLLDQIERPEQLTLATYAHRTLRRPYASGVVHLGDAAHSTSPQLGQGANMALLDCAALRQALRTHSDLTAAQRAYARQRWLHVRLYQTMSLLLTPVFQSRGRILPALRDRLFGPMRHVPGMPWLMAAVVAGRIGLRN